MLLDINISIDKTNLTLIESFLYPAVEAMAMAYSWRVASPKNSQCASVDISRAAGENGVSQTKQLLARRGERTLLSLVLPSGND